MIAKLRKLLKRDKGDAILVTAIIAIPFLYLCMGIAIDLANMVIQKNAYTNVAQRGADAAIRQIGNQGSLGPKNAGDTALPSSVKTFISTYKAEGLNRAEIQKSDRCKSMEIPGLGKKTMPYMEITLDTKRNVGISSPEAVKYVSEGNKAPTLVQNAPYKRYIALSAVVYDASPNLILGMFNEGCQLYKSTISSIAFGSQEDVDTRWNNGVPTLAPVPTPTFETG